MMSLYGVLYQEFVIFRRKFWATTIGSMISPVLYLIAFGWGLGSNIEIEGTSYMQFVIPGIIALNTMIVSYNNTANSINISRIFYKTFDAYMVAPMNMTVYAFGKVISGAFYGVYSAALIMLIVGVFGGGLVITPYFLLVALLNCFVFSAAGFLIGLMINSHADMAKFSSFVITPMSFLCGTFFPIDKMPTAIKYFINILPLTHTSQALRNTGESWDQMAQHLGILFAYFIVLLVVGIRHAKTVE